MIFNYVWFFFLGFYLSLSIYFTSIIANYFSKEKRDYKLYWRTLVFLGFMSFYICYLAYHFLVLFKISNVIQLLILNLGMIAMTISFTYAFNQDHYALKDLAKSLKLKANKRIKQLKKTEEKMEESSEQKANFFINLAHETKTSLTLISNYLEKNIKNEGTSGEIEVVIHNINKLKRNMINFLDIEKLVRKQLFYNHNQIIDFSSVLKVKILMFKEIANKKCIRIKSKIENNIYLKIDPYAIDRIINNLIDNAIKYTEEGGFIYIDLRFTNGKVEFIVNDTGIGISENQLKHIFDPYYQISYEKRNVQGIGIGLNIVKNIVDSIKGDIKIESKLGEGSIFRIEFNRYMLKEGDAVDKNIKLSTPIDDVLDVKLKAESCQEDRSNIFIVEDNINMLSYLQSSLYNKYNVFYARNGQEALEKTKSIPQLDIIISDVMMETMNGYEFCEKLLSIDEYKSIPFIFLTAKTGEDEKIKGLKKGAVDFIFKPFKIDELIAKIDSLIRIQDGLKEKTFLGVSDKIYEYLEKIENIKGYRNKNNKYLLVKLYKEYGITKRQIEIISLIKQGKENKEIADILDLKVSTVKTQIARMFEKCKVQNRIELINLFKDSKESMHTANLV